MIDQVIAAPPKLEPPADFQEWQIDTTFLIEPFLAEFKHARAEFAGELARSWDRQPPDAAFGWLKRAGLLPDREALEPSTFVRNEEGIEARLRAAVPAYSAIAAK